MHLFFEALGYIVGVIVYLRNRANETVTEQQRATVLTGAALGAAIGARLLVGFQGKTIVGGLLGGLIGVEIAKLAAGIVQSTGDRFVYPLITAIAIGRIGCFLMGPADKTAGLPTNLPWGIAMGDPVKRHPVALYEIAFLIVLGFVIQWRIGAPACPSPHLDRRGRLSSTGDRFRVFLMSYLAFRFFEDFLKPEPPPILFGLTAIQIACALGVLYYVLVFSNDERSAAVPFLRRRRVDLHDVLSED